MATTRKPRAASPEPPEPAPPFWIADVPLPAGDELGGAAPGVQAFAPGDRVPAEHVERYGWQRHVHPPPGDWPPPARPEPLTDEPGDAGAESKE